MKVAFLLVIAAASVLAKQVPTIEIGGYFQNYGIPQAERIRAAEEEFLKSSSRIVGGAPAAVGQYPWQAGLIIDLVGINGNGVCGASLLSANRLVTAAHCWWDGTNQAWRHTVVLGSTLLFTGGTRIASSNVIMHSTWDPTLFRDDVAVIYLPSDVAFNDLIAPISLPSGAELNLDYAGWTAVASGFGVTESPGGSITANQFLSHVSAPVMTNTACWWWFPGVVQNSHICISTSGGHGTCGGDSGGPLVVESNGRPILIGVTSFGFGLSCSIGWPAAFARVTSYADWLQSHM